MNLKANEIAKALGTIVDSQNIINRVSIDSRDIDEHTLFFAIKGERFDGHDFVKDVAEKGVGVQSTSAPFSPSETKFRSQIMRCNPKFTERTAKTVEKCVGMCYNSVCNAAFQFYI